MNIALVIFRNDPARGGAERYTVDLAGGLARRGHGVTVVTAEPAPAPEGVGVVALNASGWTRRRRYDRFLRSLDDHLGQAKYDIVHAMLPVNQCDLYHPHAGLAAAAMDHERRRPWTQRLGDRFNAKRRRFAAVELALLSSARPPLVLCLSEAIRTEARRYFALPDDRLVKLFNAVDLDRFDPDAPAPGGPGPRERFGIPTDAVVALMIAQDFERKGLAPAIAALAALGAGGDAGAAGVSRAGGDAGATGDSRAAGDAGAAGESRAAGDAGAAGVSRAAGDAGAAGDSRAAGDAGDSHAAGAGHAARPHLLVVGRDDPAPHRALAERLGVTDHVHFAGGVADPIPFYRAADFFVLPTRHDPCSLVVLEALAMGLPVISTVFNGACEAMVDGRHGSILPDPADTAALAGAMGRLLDRQTRWLAGAAVRALRPTLSWERHLDAVEKAYETGQS